MKRQLLTGFLVSGVLLGATAQNRAIDFKHEGTFAEHLAEATRSNKLIFFDAYTSWCVPCKVLAKEVFTVDSIADYFNANFINVGYDMEKGEGIELKKRFGSEISAYPTLLFINGKGEIVHKIVGGPPASSFLELARPALDPAMSLKGLETKFNNGDHSLNTVMAYLKCLGNANDAERTKAVATTYFDALPVADLKQEATFDLVKRYLFNIDSKTFKYILANRTALGKVHGAEKVDGYVISNLSREVAALSFAYYNKKLVDQAKEDWLTKTLGTLSHEQSPLLLIKMELISSRNRGDWAAFNKTMVKMISDAGPVKDASTKTGLMLNFTRKFAQNAPTDHLRDALGWADQLLKTDVNPLYVIDLLNFKKTIYNKLGDAEQAKAMDGQIAAQVKVKEEFEKNGRPLSSAMRGFM